ncbi:MAG TPA: cation diffusion facilitator family transporter [Candidatus Bathyarchaeia archaeon]|nr:cation diffusion facilitator family transporter [Candidatus Bathyarchaeia archaeon]
MDEPRGFSEGARIAGFSVLTQLGVGILEVAFAFLGGSVALLADGVDSISDAGISSFVWLGLRFAQKPPTRRFPYGYYKVESYAALILAFVMMGTASYIFWRSYQVFLNPRPILLPVPALAVLLGAGLIALYRALQIRRVANRYNILSLKIDAKNSIKDASGSFIAFGSVFLSTLGVQQMDAIGGMILAGYILTVSYVALKQSSLILLDAFHDPALTRQIEELVRTNKHVRGVSDLKLRRAGPYIMGTVEVKVDPEMTIREMDEVFSGLEHSIKARVAGVRTLTLKPVPSAKGDT